MTDSDDPDAPRLLDRQGRVLLTLKGDDVIDEGGRVLAHVDGNALVRANAVIGRFGRGRVRGHEGRNILTIEGNQVVNWIGQAVATVEGGTEHQHAALGLAFMEFMTGE